MNSNIKSKQRLKVFLKETLLQVYMFFINQVNINKQQNNYKLIHYIYIALSCFCKHSTLSGGVSPHPPPVCSIHLDDATAALVHQNAHHTPAYWWRGDRDEANQCMGIFRRP